MFGQILPNIGVSGNFLLGQPISQVLSRLQSQPKSFGRINIIQEPLTILVESGFKFSFDVQMQRLDKIEIFIDLVKNENRRMQGESLPPDMLICGNSIQGSLTMQEINKGMGATTPPTVKGDKALLVYPGITFVFTKNILSKLTIFCDEFSPGPISKQICSKKCKIMLNHGIEFYFESQQCSMHKRIFFGQPMPEVLDKLGPPNKEYHKVADNVLFLNYFELGVDVQIETKNYSVKKIVVRTNNPVCQEFCFYERCYFELELQQQERDEMDSGIATPPKEEEKIIHQEVINLKDSDFDKDKSIGSVSKEPPKLLVTPLTPFSEVFSFMQVPDNDFHENPETKSRFYAYSQGVIFEVNNDQIASIQLIQSHTSIEKYL